MHVIVHGGAGSPADEPADRQGVLDTSVVRGCEAETPLVAVVRSIRVLECDPRFNAGVGGAVQSDGAVRTDAGIMLADGTTGAVAAMPGVENAVDVARAVALETPHVLLAGDRAVAFGDAAGVETGGDLLTAETRERFRAADPPEGDPIDHAAWVRDRFGGRGDASDGSPADGTSADHDHDTVGAVAGDGQSVAAATATAGRWYALAGRVGDVPQVGAGFYASPAGGASATGAGEDIARTGLARRAVGLLDNGVDPDTAAERAIEAFDDRSSGTAGLVLMNAAGEAGKAHSSPAMQTARGP
jgi:beta-aspartyl-peptidase (threonine type)